MKQYTWRPATGQDIPLIVALAQRVEYEIDNIFTPDPVVYAKNITYATLNQFYSPNTELLSVAIDQDNNLVGYTWAKSNEYAPWSDQQMIVVCMAHVDLDLSSRDKVRLIQDMMRIWESWASIININIICSTTIRKDQTAFLKLHERAGYDIRGSYAYKKLV